MRRILVYGSLREDQYNFNRIKANFGNDSIKKIESKEIEGFNMYDLGPYPCVTKGSGKIQCEIMEVNDRAAEAIEMMEIGAGYTGSVIGDATIYTMDREMPENILVKNGDWVLRNIPEKQN